MGSEMCIRDSFSSVADVMASEGMPQDEILGIPAHKYLLCGAIVFLILGGLSVAAGLKARLGACMLFFFLIGATTISMTFGTQRRINSQPK